MPEQGALCRIIDIAGSGGASGGASGKARFCNYAAPRASIIVYGQFNWQQGVAKMAIPSLLSLAADRYAIPAGHSDVLG